MRPPTQQPPTDPAADPPTHSPQLGIYSESKKRWMTSRVPNPHGLIFIIFIPAFTGKTAELRRVVPKQVGRRD